MFGPILSVGVFGAGSDWVLGKFRETYVSQQNLRDASWASCVGCSLFFGVCVCVRGPCESLVVRYVSEYVASISVLDRCSWRTACRNSRRGVFRVLRNLDTVFQEPFGNADIHREPPQKRLADMNPFLNDTKESPLEINAQIPSLQ